MPSKNPPGNRKAGRRPLTPAELRAAARLAADWEAARGAGQRKGEFIRARFADPKVAAVMRRRLDDALRLLRQRDG